MSADTWHLPWEGEDVPHALLDILRGCNISCRACYNAPGARIKSLEEIRAEVDILQQFRRLDSISVVGGEVTLHPDLCQIVRMLKSRGLRVELFSNGLDLDRRMLCELREAGTDIIFLHVDSAQTRPDLPAEPTPEDVFHLVDEKSRLVTANGIEAGLAITGYADRVDEIVATVKHFLDSSWITYLLVTLCRDLDRIAHVEGDLSTGMSGTITAEAEGTKEEALDNNLIHALMEREFGLSAFARLGSNLNRDDLRWLSYLVASIGKQSNGTVSHEHLCLKVSHFEKAYLRLHKLLRGRYPFYVPQNPAALRVQLLLNGLFGGRLFANAGFLGKTLCRKGTLKAKRILFQEPAMVGDDGRVVHCRQCPDAVVRNGKLVPVCISDKVRPVPACPP